LLLGGGVPILARPQGQKHTLVEDCFIDGVMDGEELVEAWKRAQPDENHEDTPWLNGLYEEPLPFMTQDFVLI
jgi:hypothetical protein